MEIEYKEEIVRAFKSYVTKIIQHSAIDYVRKMNNIKSTFEIVLMFEKYIDKHCYIKGEFSQECKDYIIDKLLTEIRKFKKI